METPLNAVPMPAKQREELKRLAAAATPGPWRTDGFASVLTVAETKPVYDWSKPLGGGKYPLTGHESVAIAHLDDGEYIENPNARQDAEYLAAVPPDVALATLAYVEALEAEVERRKDRDAYTADTWLVTKQFITEQGEELNAARAALATLEAEAAAAKSRAEKAESAMHSLAEDLWDSYDHDQDAHRYGTTCRKCLGRAFAEGYAEPWHIQWEGNQWDKQKPTPEATPPAPLAGEAGPTDAEVMRAVFKTALLGAGLWDWFLNSYGTDWQAEDANSDGWSFEKNAITYRICDIFSNDYADGYNWRFERADSLDEEILTALVGIGFKIAYNSGDEEDAYLRLELPEKAQPYAAGAPLEREDAAGQPEKGGQGE